MGRLRVGLLGPLEVTSDGRALELNGTKLRAVLAMLAIHPGVPVPLERLVEGIWGEQPPQRARNIIQVNVGRWRRLLLEERCDASISQRRGTYVLEMAPEQVDLVQFGALVERGRKAMIEERHGAAAYAFKEAAALVRGPVLEEFAELPFHQWESVPIDAALVQIAADRLECLLALGGGGELIAELESLVGAHPFEERFRAQLMHALYRAGRQVEALRAYESARQTLADVGLEPGPALRAMEQSILRQDQALDSRSSPFTPPAPPVPLTSLIGRVRDVQQVVTQVRDSSDRLITLIGPGGVGKTRLAIEVATRIAEQGWTPVAYISLADVSDPLLVPTFINAAFGVPESWRERPLRDVVRMLGRAPC